MMTNAKGSQPEVGLVKNSEAGGWIDVYILCISIYIYIYIRERYLRKGCESG